MLQHVTQPVAPYASVEQIGVGKIRGNHRRDGYERTAFA